MNARRIGAIGAAAALAFGLAACGSDDGGDNAGGGGDAGKKLKIGIKFDQPGLGLKKGTEVTGFDIDMAKYVAKELGTAEKDITWVQAPSPQRETLIKTGQVDLIFATYSITDKRKADVTFAGPYFIAGQDLLVRSDDTSITGADSLTGKKLCSVKGSTPAQKVKDKYPGVQLLEYSTYSECLPALTSKKVDALTTDDTILAGYAAQAEFKGKFKLVGKPFSEENYGVGLKKGDVALCNKVTDALKKAFTDGTWQKAIDANLGPAGYKPGPGNPPTPAACA
ncbi:glutamate ABC transporter substrate-binding protein [Knoellia sp. CPCC 206453]|uniref:glutamate ABC transporter substrate-binding protein n=1 Tax=Knoellia pratensis TaxID=3404796 RepID=UPI00361FC578